MKGSQVRNILVLLGVVAVVVIAAWLKSGSDASPSDRAPTGTHEGSPIQVKKQQPSPDKIDERTTPSAAAKGPRPEKKLPRLIDLGADKCIPCRKMAPILEEVKKEWAGRAIVQFIDVWKNPDASKKYGVRLIPTQIFFDRNGKEARRHEGFLSKEDIEDWLEMLMDEG